MKKRNIKYKELIAGSLALMMAASACSKKETEYIPTQSIVYVVVTATPTPTPTVLSIFNTENTVFDENQFIESNDNIIVNNGTTPSVSETTIETIESPVETNENTIETTIIPVETTIPALTETTYETAFPTETQNDYNGDSAFLGEDLLYSLWNGFIYIDNAINNFSLTETRNRAINEVRQLIDFIFYGGEINGITFAELTENGKIEAYERLQRLDEQIMQFDPDYKERLGAIYNRVRNFVITTYENARDIFNSRIDIDINIYENGNEGMTAPRTLSLKKEK